MDGPLRDNVRSAIYQGRDLCVSGIENNKGVFWKEIGIRRQYDSFMVKMGKQKGQVKGEEDPAQWLRICLPMQGTWV